MKKFLIMSAAYFAIIGAAALLPLLFIEKKEHKVTVMEEAKWHPVKPDKTNKVEVHWATLPAPQRHLESLMRENRDLHFINILKSEIIVEIMDDNEALRAIINESKCSEK